MTMNSSLCRIKDLAQEQDEGMWSATLVAVGSANVKHSLGKLLGQSGASFAEDITTEMYEQKKNVGANLWPAATMDFLLWN